MRLTLEAGPLTVPANVGHLVGACNDVVNRIRTYGRFVVQPQRDFNRRETSGFYQNPVDVAFEICHGDYQQG
jgi:hypothetical protein